MSDITAEGLINHACATGAFYEAAREMAPLIGREMNAALLAEKDAEIARLQSALKESEERCLKHVGHEHCVTPCDSIRIQDSNHSAWLDEKFRADRAERLVEIWKGKHAAMVKIADRAEAERDALSKAGLAFVEAYDAMLLEDSGCSISIDWQGKPGCGRLFDNSVETRNEINRLVRPEAYEFTREDTRP
jgi:hypothetical protein